MNVRIRLALGVSAIFGVLAMPAIASAVPGDRAISDPLPGSFRLDDGTLEPGCFVPGRNAPVDIDSHLVIGTDGLGEEAHVSVTNGAALSVDQVLVPSPIDGYSIYNTFDTGTVNTDADVDPNQTATLLSSPTRFVDQRDIIVCLSGHGDAGQNEPYAQEDGGLVSAINRPVIAPEVTALGVSPLAPLNTLRVGFGYNVEQWYSGTMFDQHELFPAVTDPEASFFDSMGIPNVVRIAPRPNDFPYDAQRVNDVDEAGEAWTGGDVSDGQNMFLSRSGDSTAWIRGGLTQGDLPYSWTLRPSLANPAAERMAALTDDDYRAWNAAWQAYYRGAGPKPSLPLAPRSNSPKPDTSVIVNMPESRPTSAPQVVVSVTAPAAQPAQFCKGFRVVRFSFSKKATAGKIRYNGKTVRAHKSDGRLRAAAKLRGVTAHSANARTKIVKMTKSHGSWHSKTLRVKICA